MLAEEHARYYAVLVKNQEIAMPNSTPTISKIVTRTLLAAATGLVMFSAPAFADEEFYGRVESRPEGNVGVWTISGQQVQVTDKTKFDLDNGPLVVGSCAEVEHKKGVVKELETAKPAKCDKK